MNAFGADLYIAASRRYQGDDSKYLYRLCTTVLAITIFHWLQPMMFIIMNLPDDSYRILLPASVKNVPSIMQDFYYIQMQKDI